MKKILRAYRMQLKLYVESISLNLILQLSCVVEVLGELLMPKPHPRLFTSESLGMDQAFDSSPADSNMQLRLRITAL